MTAWNTVNWPLVLEFVKALAAPTAAVIVAWTAAKLAIRGFRSQKLIERRLDWHESMFERLQRTATAFNRASISGRKDHVEEAHEALAELLLLSMTATLYADQQGLFAVTKLIADIELPDSMQITPSIAEMVQQACTQAMEVLAAQLRNDLKLPRLRHQ